MSHRALGEQFRHVVTSYPDGTYSSKQVAQQDLDDVSAPAKQGIATKTATPQGRARFILAPKQKAKISVHPVRRDTLR